MRKISASLKENVQEFKKILHVDKNFDLIYREQKLGSKDAGFFFIDGFIKDTIMERLLNPSRKYRRGIYLIVRQNFLINIYLMWRLTS